MGVRVMDRCNLTIFEVEGQEDLPEFLAGEQVEIVASMPCYLEDNVDRQRGKGVFDASIRGLQAPQRAGLRPRRLGPRAQPRLQPARPSLPPPQAALEADYKRVLGDNYGVAFNKLYTLANMPIQRFGSTLISKGEFDSYLDMLQHAHLDANLDGVMCRNLISVDWRGFVYDCDFNQMLDLPLARGDKRARASVRTARRRPRRQSDPRRRALLRLHRRPGFELRRRAERGGGIAAATSAHGLAVHHRSGARRGGAHRRGACGAGAVSGARRRGDRRRRRQPRPHRGDRRARSPTG